MRHPWHITDDGVRFLGARRLPARFDIDASTTLPLMRADRLALQVRQDMWRALRRLRGFAPVVEITRHEDHLVLRAGGQVKGPVPKRRCQAQLASLLEDRALRARWTRWAA